MTKHFSTCPAGRMVASVLMIIGASAAFAANPPVTAQPNPSKEMREKMATLHEQMAACLRSDKPIAECHSQLMKACQDTMDMQSCAMMGHGMMGSGPRTHGGMPQAQTPHP